MKKKEKLNHNRLAEGEVTGHAHRASAGVAVYDIGNDELLAEELEQWYLSHEEHGPCTLPTHQHSGTQNANYVRRIVQEFDHAAESARKVID